jgi:hypothetical protein
MSSVTQDGAGQTIIVPDPTQQTPSGAYVTIVGSYGEQTQGVMVGNIATPVSVPSDKK